MSGTVCISVVFLYRRRYLYTQGMTTDLHDLKPGYYWYTMANDPLAVIHIHEDGGASLMGTDLSLIHI